MCVWSAVSPDITTADQLPQPLRVVLDPRLRTPPSAKMVSLRGDTLVVCQADAKDSHPLAAAGVEVLRLPGQDGRIDLGALLDELGRRQINELLVEAGPRLAGAFLAAGLVDELVLYAAPHLMGDTARGLFHLPGLERMEQRISLRINDLRMLGSDIRIVANPVSASGQMES